MTRLEFLSLLIGAGWGDWPQSKIPAPVIEAALSGQPIDPPAVPPPPSPVGGPDCPLDESTEPEPPCGKRPLRKTIYLDKNGRIMPRRIGWRQQAKKKPARRETAFAYRDYEHLQVSMPAGRWRTGL